MQWAGLGMWVALTLSACTPTKREVGNLNVIPQPQEVVQNFQENPFVIHSGTKIVYPAGNEKLERTAEFLASYIKEATGLTVQCTTENKESDAIILSVDTAIKQKEGYRLEVTSNNIRLAGGSEAGVFYGIQTLHKSMPVTKDRESASAIPAGIVNDYPRFDYRGFMVDVGRHYFPVSYLKQIIDMLALHNINYFHWHLTDDQAWRVEMKCRPELTAKGSVREGEIEGLYPGKYQPLPYGGYYTHEDVREVVRYAAERYITVIPEIDIPGHCMAVLATYPQFSTTPDEPKKCALTWGIFNKFNNVLAPKPEVFDFLKDVFSELCDLFPGQYIHVGGDECAKRWWQESEQTQRFMRDHGLADEKALQSYFIHYVQDVVNAKGKTLVGWDEILEGGISEDCIIMNWRRPNYGVKALKTGHRAIFACSAWSYFNMKESRTQSEIGPRGPLSLEKVYEFQIVPDSLTDRQTELIWGAQGCLWTEYIPTTWKVEFSLFPRMAALAENVWSPVEKKSWDNFSRKVETQCERYELWGARYSDAFFRLQDIVRKR